MIVKVNLVMSLLMIFAAFVDNKWIPFHIFVVFMAGRMKKWQKNNKDVYFAGLLWVYKLILLLLVKNDYILWIVYDVIAIILGIYFLTQALKFLFCK